MELHGGSAAPRVYLSCGREPPVGVDHAGSSFSPVEEMQMADQRKYIINPYTFVPLGGEPICKEKGPEAPHAAFNEECFTGTIECELTLVTPAVLAGKQAGGTKNEFPGTIECYTNNCHLAIPGSRLRGHLLHLMRAINSSPICQHNEHPIFRREEGTLKKGFLKKKSDDEAWRIQEVPDEVLVCHPQRSRKPRLDGGCVPAEEAVLWNEKGPENIPLYRDKPGGALGMVFYHNPIEQRDKVVKYKEYAVDITANQEQQPKSFPEDLRGQGDAGLSDEHRWVKFESLSGIDGENMLVDATSDNPLAQAHLNQWHVVDIASIDEAKSVDLPNGVIENFRATQRTLVAGVASLVDKTKDAKTLNDKRREKLEESIKKRLGDSMELNEGDFVYFKTARLQTENGKGLAEQVVSFGKHYRYLVLKGRMGEKVHQSNKDLAADFDQPCAVGRLSGYVNENGTSQMKGRLWVEMAKGPKMHEACNSGLLVVKNLRILASQPPKAFRFYLKNESPKESCYTPGDYNDPESRVRGRKFYWHDPAWDKPMWDNVDLRQGEWAFENPQPNQDKLFEQWQQAFVLAPKPETPITFRFKLRVMNLTTDERRLLLTALVGFNPAISPINGEPTLCSDDDYEWLHKIGHARPYMGSARIRILGVNRLGFNPISLEPQSLKLEQEDMQSWLDDLSQWQGSIRELAHIQCLRRVMHFDGAHQDWQKHTTGPENVQKYDSVNKYRDEVRIHYPLGQKASTVMLSWKVPEKSFPKIYGWFTSDRYKQCRLPVPEPDTNQSLETHLKKS